MGDAKQYTTGDDGSFTVTGLYEYVEGKNATGKYTLTEQHAPAGYVKNSENIEFVVSKNSAGKSFVNSSKLVWHFFSAIFLNCSSTFFTFNPCQGRKPFRKYIRQYPMLSTSSLLLNSKPL